MTPPPTVALEACPFCPDGGKPGMRAWRDEDGLLWVNIHCASCGIKTRGMWCRPENDCPQFRQDRRDEWNQRHVATPKPVECEPKYNCRECSCEVELNVDGTCELCGGGDVQEFERDCQPSVAEGAAELAEVNALIAEEQRNQLGFCAVDFQLMVRIASRLRTAQPAAPSAPTLTDAQREACEAGAMALKHRAVERRGWLKKVKEDSFTARSFIDHADDCDKQAATLRDLAQRGR